MITREDLSDIAGLRLSHGKVNALDVEFCDAVVEELTRFARSDARALIITGTGSSFSAGVDLFQVMEGGADYLARFLPAMEKLFLTLLVLPKPVIAAVNGHAIAGGCIIASACDYRVMVEGKARIGIPELAVGVPFPTLPFEIMRSRLSPAPFHDLVFSGRTVLAPEALQLGLVDEIASSDTLIARAQHAAERLARTPPVTFALTKRALTGPVLARVNDAVALNAEAIAAWASPDVQQRMREYVEATVGKR